MASQTGHGFRSVRRAHHRYRAVPPRLWTFLLNANERLANRLTASESASGEQRVHRNRFVLCRRFQVDFKTRRRRVAPLPWRSNGRTASHLGPVHLSERVVSGRTYVCAEIRDITEYFETHHREELLWRILRHNLRNVAKSRRYLSPFAASAG